MKILANDGVSQSGIDVLTEAGFEVITTNIAQEQLINFINENKITVLLVRSATTARKELIDSCPGLKIIGRGGVGMDNIDVEYAREKGLSVINTPAASSSSGTGSPTAYPFSVRQFRCFFIYEIPTIQKQLFPTRYHFHLVQYYRLVQNYPYPLVHLLQVSPQILKKVYLLQVFG